MERFILSLRNENRMVWSSFEHVIIVPCVLVWNVLGKLARMEGAVAGSVGSTFV